MQWSNEDLSNYITKFSDEQRESVLKQIVESELIQKFLDTTEGRLVLDGTVDLIRDCTMKIVSLSLNGFEKNLAEIKQSALQIDVAHKFMHRIASTVMSGEAHAEEIKQ